MKKPVYYAILVVLIGVFLFSAYKLGSYWLEKVRSDRLLDDASKFVHVDDDTNLLQPGTVDGDPEKINVDFEALAELNDDIVAWIYCPNTQINYPIVQGEDNEYYLYRLLDGTWNGNGSIFMDYENNSDFSNGNTLIYGHHMKTGAMFGELSKYKKQSFYDEHPYMYILTPQQNYRMDLFAACVVDSTADIYTFAPSEDILRDCISRSTFTAKVDYPTHNVVTLSTCTSEYDNARYVVLGDLVPIDK